MSEPLHTLSIHSFISFLAPPLGSTSSFFALSILTTRQLAQITLLNWDSPIYVLHLHLHCIFSFFRPIFIISNFQTLVYSHQNLFDPPFICLCFAMWITHSVPSWRSYTLNVLLSGLSWYRLFFITLNLVVILFTSLPDTLTTPLFIYTLLTLATLGSFHSSKSLRSLHSCEKRFVSRFIAHWPFIMHISNVSRLSLFTFTSGTRYLS